MKKITASQVSDIQTTLIQLSQKAQSLVPSSPPDFGITDAISASAVNPGAIPAAVILVAANVVTELVTNRTSEKQQQALNLASQLDNLRAGYGQLAPCGSSGDLSLDQSVIATQDTTYTALAEQAYTIAQYSDADFGILDNLLPSVLGQTVINAIVNAVKAAMAEQESTTGSVADEFSASFTDIANTLKSLPDCTADKPVPPPTQPDPTPLPDDPTQSPSPSNSPDPSSTPSPSNSPSPNPPPTGDNCTDIINLLSKLIDYVENGQSGSGNPTDNSDIITILKYQNQVLQILNNKDDGLAKAIYGMWKDLLDGRTENKLNFQGTWNRTSDIRTQVFQTQTYIFSLDHRVSQALDDLTQLVENIVDEIVDTIKNQIKMLGIALLAIQFEIGGLYLVVIGMCSAILTEVFLLGEAIEIGFVELNTALGVILDMIFAVDRVVGSILQRLFTLERSVAGLSRQVSQIWSLLSRPAWGTLKGLDWQPDPSKTRIPTQNNVTATTGQNLKKSTLGKNKKKQNNDVDEFNSIIPNNEDDDNGFHQTPSLDPTSLTPVTPTNTLESDEVKLVNIEVPWTGDNFVEAQVSRDNALAVLLAELVADVKSKSGGLTETVQISITKVSCSDDGNLTSDKTPTVITVPASTKDAFQLLFDQQNQIISMICDNYCLWLPEITALSKETWTPQLTLFYKKDNGDGTLDGNVTSTITIQQYDMKRLGEPTTCPIPTYRKGSTIGQMLIARKETPPYESPTVTKKTGENYFAKCKMRPGCDGDQEAFRVMNLIETFIRKDYTVVEKRPIPYVAFDKNGVQLPDPEVAPMVCCYAKWYAGGLMSKTWGAAEMKALSKRYVYRKSTKFPNKTFANKPETYEAD